MKMLIFWAVTLCGLLPVAARAQSWLWAFPPATNTVDYTTIQRVRLDSLGNTYVLGRCDSPATVGGVRLPRLCYYVARIDYLGQVQWVRPVGQPSRSVTSTDLATDRAGRCYVTGTFYGAVTIGTTPLQSVGVARTSAFVGTLDAAGQWGWVAAAEGGTRTSLVAVSPRGQEVWTVGLFQDSLRCGAVVLHGTTLTRSLYVARLTAATGGWAGAWGVAAAASSTFGPAALVADDSAQVYLTGSYAQRATFGTTTLTCSSTGGSCGLIAKFSATAGWKWARSWGTDNNSSGQGVVIRPNSHQVMTGGYFGGRTTLDTITFTVPPNFPAAGFVGCLDDMTGRWCWAKKMGLPGQTGPFITTLGMDAAETLYVAGSVGSNMPPIIFGPDTIRPRSIFVASADSRSGQWQHAWTTSGPGSAGVTALAANAPGEVVIGGTVGTPAPQFGPFTIPPNLSPTGTAYVAKLLDPNPPTGLPPVVVPGAWALWPNPASHRATLRLAAPARQAQALEVRDALGRLCYRTQVAAGQTEASFDVAGLPAGLYVVRCGREAKRLVVAP